MGNSADIKILAIDSSSFTGSVALCQGEKLVGESLLNVRSTHSENLLRQIDLLLADTGWQLQDLDLLVAVTGPGSFTGLRIGIATIKGLAQVVAKPVIGVSSLQMLAMNLPLSPVPICAFMDARKKEVYSQLFRWSEEGPQPVGEAQVLPPQHLLQQIDCQVAFVGDGVPLYQQEIIEALGEKALLPNASAHQVRASQAAWLGWQGFVHERVDTAAELLPIYIRPSDAELGHKKKS
ncbi:tRNA (adenosine(37)-N6)-threonylcarbamoyltransferase complex dimerization subunit type 1 TsaB [Malonomonas rubra]|uniref:tRNA (adenosine(37)-N6)-threonylcarbamoyltransferase complex dimerization subunit type 1 TsaB n=1 Tax=Malonomonas rubra TaxID=57040 RepID=UPI0026EDB0E6|nr:tRNA (adenosine(37)-N6)-threonylcarbamoyltransferase complex dimerization subunit type 1 TsaB [Malonomonas rubra]